MTVSETMDTGDLDLQELLTMSDRSLEAFDTEDEKNDPSFSLDDSMRCDSEHIKDISVRTGLHN